MHRVTILWGLVCAAMLVPDTAANDHLTLFHESFEEDASTWTIISGATDNPDAPGWEIVAGEDAYDGRRYARLSTNGDICYRAVETFLSPLIEHDGGKLAVSLRLQYRQADRAGVRTSEIYLAALDERGDVIEVAPLAEGDTRGLCEDWRNVTASFSRVKGHFRLGIRFSSPSTVCDELRIDAVRVLGLQSEQADTVITEPAADIRPWLGVGETLALEAAPVEDTEARYDWYIAARRSLITCLEGRAVSYAFTEPGVYTVFCRITNGQGLVDPTPAMRTVLVSDRTALDTEITSPDTRSEMLAAGQSLQLSAAAVNGDEHTGFIWEIIDRGANRQVAPRYGQTVDIVFETPGRFEVLCAATDGDPSAENALRDPSPARLNVEVSDVLVEITEPSGRGRIGEKVLDLAEIQALTARVEDPSGMIARLVWRVLEKDENLGCDNATSCAFSADERGVYTVALQALDADSETLARDAFRFYVGAKLFFDIDPSTRIDVAVDAPFSIRAALKGTLADHPDTEVQWVFNGKNEPGLTLENKTIAEPGHYQVRAIARNRAEDVRFERRVEVMVYDPETLGRPRITSPQTSWRLPQGGTLFFDSSFPQLPLDDLNPYWEIVNEAGDVLTTGHSATLGRVTFEDEGTYEANLYLRSPKGDLSADSLTIWVADVVGLDFDSNTELEAATPIENGTYVDLVLDRGHYYEVEVSRDQTIEVWIDPGPAGEAVVVFENFDGNVIRVPVVGKRLLQLGGLPPGSYRWGVEVPEDPAKRKAGLSFSFGVNVFNPALFFTDISEDPAETTSLGVVNTTNGEADIEVIAYDSSGNILGKVSRVLGALGATRESVEELFPDVIAPISWVRVDSTADVVGFSHTVSTDSGTAYAVNAATYLQPQLFVPHIAERVETWYTRANVVNGQSETISSVLKAGAVEQATANSASYTKDRIDFVESFGGFIPADASWGQFIDEGGDATLAGNEIFGTVDGTDQVVGLGLFGAPAANPNFTAITDQLYFTHIAQSADFWTGIALVNLGNATLEIPVKAYGAEGALVGTGTVTLAAGDKRVWEISRFFDEAGITGTVLWMELTTEGSVSGYELFGTTDTTRMAGLEATSEPSESICMPFVDTSGEHWHGMAVVNTSEQPAELTLTLRDDVGGEATAPVTVTLAGKEKRIFLLTDLFEGLPLTGAWLQLNANRPIVGFELFGNQGDSHMSGLLAQ